jgi:hypothetical protein
MSTIQERHDSEIETTEILKVANMYVYPNDAILKQAHKDRGELLDALREIGVLGSDYADMFGADSCCITPDDIQAILDKLGERK